MFVIEGFKETKDFTNFDKVSAEIGWGSSFECLSMWRQQHNDGLDILQETDVKPPLLHFRHLCVAPLSLIV